MSQTSGRSLTRRGILGTTITGAAALALGAPAAFAAEQPAPPPASTAAPDRWRGLKFGIATYSLRKLPLDAALKVFQRVGLAYASIKDFHMPMRSTAEERRATVQKFVAAGVTPLSCGVITLPNDEAKTRAAFQYAKDAGIGTIVAAPARDALPLVERCCKEFDIRIALHNHGPEDRQGFHTPADAMEALSKFDARLGICVDVGHTARAKADPVRAIRDCRERLYDVHIKDLDSTARNGKDIEAGRGVLDLKSILAALLEMKFTGLVGIEYEKDADDPLAGIAETVGYLRGLLAGM